MQTSKFPPSVSEQQEIQIVWEMIKPIQSLSLSLKKEFVINGDSVTRDAPQKADTGH